MIVVVGTRKPNRGKPLGAELKALRDARGMSQQEAADLAGVSVGNWAKYEQGRVAVSRSAWLAFVRGLGLADDGRPKSDG